MCTILQEVQMRCDSTVMIFLKIPLFSKKTLLSSIAFIILQEFHCVLLDCVLDFFIEGGLILDVGIG